MLINLFGFTPGESNIFDNGRNPDKLIFIFIVIHLSSIYFDILTITQLQIVI